MVCTREKRVEALCKKCVCLTPHVFNGCFLSVLQGKVNEVIIHPEDVKLDSLPFTREKSLDQLGFGISIRMQINSRGIWKLSMRKLMLNRGLKTCEWKVKSNLQVCRYECAELTDYRLIRISQISN